MRILLLLVPLRAVFAAPPQALFFLSQLNPAGALPTFLPDSAQRNAEASFPMKLLVSKHPLLSLHSPLCQRWAWTPRKAQGRASSGVDSHTPCLPGFRATFPTWENRNWRLPNSSAMQGEKSSNRLQGVQQFSWIPFQKHQSLGFKHLVVAWSAFSTFSPLPLVSIERLLCYSCCLPPVARCHHQTLGRYRITLSAT